MQLVYTGTKLDTKFNVKYKSKKECHHDLTYSAKCSMKNCLQPYNAGRRLAVVNEHSGKYVNSHMFKGNHPTLTLVNFTVLSSGYRNRKFKKKVPESLFIKQNRPALNKHGISIPLTLFN